MSVHDKTKILTLKADDGYQVGMGEGMMLAKLKAWKLMQRPCQVFDHTGKKVGGVFHDGDQWNYSLEVAQ